MSNIKVFLCVYLSNIKPLCPKPSVKSATDRNATPNNFGGGCWGSGDKENELRSVLREE